MSDPQTIAELVEVMKMERANWTALLLEIGVSRLADPGVEGDWSIKDIVAHLTHYENAVADWLTALLNGAPKPPAEFAGLSMDERNALIYERHHTRSLAEVLADSERAFKRSIDVVRRLRDEQLHDLEFTRRFGVDYSAHDLIEGDTYGHYREHITSVRAWLAGQRTKAAVV